MTDEEADYSTEDFDSATGTVALADDTIDSFANLKSLCDVKNKITVGLTSIGIMLRRVPHAHLLAWMRRTRCARRPRLYTHRAHLTDH